MKKFITTTLAALVLLFQVPVSAQAPAPDPLLHTFGTVTAQSLFSTYMAIAELGDLYAAKAYDQAKTTQVAGSFKNIAEAAKTALTALVASGKLGASDVEFAQQAAGANELLGQTAQALINVAADPSDANRTVFEEHRQKTWKVISGILGIDK